MIGYFGKIPGHGDFVSRGLPPALVEAWDGWLQDVVRDSQQQLGGQWLTHYLTSPVWRFAIAPGVLGPEGLGGVLMPSVDRVGRYFPLMIGATGAPPLLDWLQAQARWYDAIEEAARAALDPAVGLRGFEAVAAPAVEDAASVPVVGGVQRFTMDAMVGARVAAAAMRGKSLWWTDAAPDASGGESVLLMCAGMPSPQTFTAMLDKDRQGRAA